MQNAVGRAVETTVSTKIQTQAFSSSHLQEEKYCFSSFIWIYWKDKSITRVSLYMYSKDLDQISGC